MVLMNLKPSIPWITRKKIGSSSITSTTICAFALTILYAFWLSPSAGTVAEVISILEISETNTTTALGYSISLTGVWAFVGVAIMSALVMLWVFSSYLEFDAAHTDFTVKLISFFLAIFGLLVAVTSLLLTLFWEIVGIVSFRLISHWVDRANTTQGAIIAIGFNRIGDFLLLVWLVGSLNLGQHMQGIQNTLPQLAIYFGLVFKSVNFITFLWLPEAMEGPTPVSSLLHSCTLVMAGIFIFLRVSLGCSVWLILIGTLSLWIVFKFSIDDKDSKRLIATTTVIMTGLIFLVLVIGLPVTTILICTFHAIYKSLLFVTAGKLIAKMTIASEAVLSVQSASYSFPLFSLFTAIALPGTAYASAKHGLSVSSNLSDIASPITLIVSLSISLFWFSTIKIFSTVNFRGKSYGFPDFILSTAIIGVVISSLILPTVSGYCATSYIAIVMILFLSKLLRSSFTTNIGSTSMSSDFESIGVWRYSFLTRMFMVINKVSSLSIDFMSIAVIGVIAAVIGI